MHYFTIPLIAAATAGICVLLARSGMPWFRTLRFPGESITGKSVAYIQAAMFALGALSAIFAWNATGTAEHPRLTAVYLVNAFLNAAWCYLLFVRHQIGSATLDAALMAIAVAVILLEVYPASPLAALLVAPFFVWALFGMYLTFTIFRMNVRGGGGDV